jgi:predicted amidophosphoribosyltransferase
MGLVTNRECPFCKRPARSDATVCPHCTRDIPAVDARVSPLFYIVGLILVIIVAAFALLNR